MVAKWSNINRSRTFQTFREGYTLWKVEIGDDLGATNCNCPKFGLYGCCKHVLVCLIKLNMTKVPEKFSKKQIVYENNKRGRVPKSLSGLRKEL